MLFRWYYLKEANAPQLITMKYLWKPSHHSCSCSCFCVNLVSTFSFLPVYSMLDSGGVFNTEILLPNIIDHLHIPDIQHCIKHPWRWWQIWRPKACPENNDGIKWIRKYGIHFGLVNPLAIPQFSLFLFSKLKICFSKLLLSKGGHLTQYSYIR